MMWHLSRSPIRHRFAVAVMAVVTLGGATVAAHDLWIEPASFAPQSGEILALRLRVGQDFLGDPVARDSSLIKEFVVEDAEGRKPVVGRDRGDPAGFVRVATPGLMVVGYFSNASMVDLTADKLNQYLNEEGLDGVASLRARRHETGAGAREMFSRCAKSLILSGAPSDAELDRRLGCTIELVAERNPYALGPGQDLPVRLTYENRPLPGALVVAMNRMNPAEKLSARTDKDGRVRFPVKANGMWLIKAVHMVPAPAGVDANWVSFWASLTFERRTSHSAGN